MLLCGQTAPSQSIIWLLAFFYLSPGKDESHCLSSTNSFDQIQTWIHAKVPLQLTKQFNFAKAFPQATKRLCVGSCCPSGIPAQRRKLWFETVGSWRTRFLRILTKTWIWTEPQHFCDLKKGCVFQSFSQNMGLNSNSVTKSCWGSWRCTKWQCFSRIPSTWGTGGRRVSNVIRLDRQFWFGGGPIRFGFGRIYWLSQFTYLQNEVWQQWSQFMEVHPGPNHVHYWAPFPMWIVPVWMSWSIPSLRGRWPRIGECPASEFEVFCGRDFVLALGCSP